MIDKPHQISLSAHAQKILSALIACGEGWHGRSEIARQIGKKRLNGFDAALLELLRESGKVEVIQETARGPIGYAWKYRVKGIDGEKMS